MGRKDGLKGPLTVNSPVDGSLKPTSAAEKNRARTRLKEIRGIYSWPAQFKRPPRSNCAGIGLWIARSTLERPWDVLGKFIGVLGGSSYFVLLKGGSVLVDRSRAVKIEAVVHEAIHGTQFLMAMCNEWAAIALEALGKESFIAVRGSEDGFAKEFGLAC